MSFLAIQSVPLGRETRRALERQDGVVIAHNSDDLDRLIRRSLEYGYQFVLNMGNSWIDIERAISPVLNDPYEVSLTRTPGALRKNFEEFLPPWPSTADEYPLDCWIKTPGRAGRGKYHKAVHYPLVLPSEWDCQKHVEGKEYRVITVGHRAVQGFLREGPNRARRYIWTGLMNTPDEVLKVARTAAKKLTHNNLRAWDLVQAHTGEVFLLESNSSPGMNTATAERVITEIKRQLEEGRIT